MSTHMTTLTQSPAWKELSEHFQQARDLHLHALFVEDPRRDEHLKREADGIYLNYSN